MLGGGCAPPPPPVWVPPSPPPPPQPRQIPDDEAVLPWGGEEPFLVVIEKSCQRLNLYSYGRLLKSYPAVFGLRKGRKVHQGDKRTPTGLYRVVRKSPHPRWGYFLLLDYPTAYDVSVYWQNVALGRVPKITGGYPEVGGNIGIHGTDKEELNRSGVNWTLGCISLYTKDVRDLYARVPLDTLVYIRE